MTQAPDALASLSNVGLPPDFHEHRGASFQARAGRRAQGWSPAAVVHCQGLASPQALALDAPDGQFSYGQLARQASGLAQALTRHPAWPAYKDEPPRVGVLASRSAQACIAVLGASWAGATYVPLGTRLPEDRLLPILSRCRLSALVVDVQEARLLSDTVLRAAPPIVVALGPRLPKTLPGAVTWLSPQALGASPPQAPAAMKPEHAAYIMFTSGTTGEPKGVVVPLAAVSHLVCTATPMMGLRADDRVMDTFDLTFDVSVQTMFCTWQAGASMHMLPATRVMNAVSFVRERGLTVWISVPSLVGMLRQVKALGPGVMPSLRLSVFGGEQLTRSTVDTWKTAAPGSVIYNQYGPTEATVFCLMQCVDDGQAALPGRDGISIGQPLPGSEAMVLDPDLQPLPDGQAGELALGGVQLASGYLGEPEQTAARFVMIDGKRWYLTGDLALREAGRFYCLGRLDNQVKVLGYRMELEDIDAHLQQVAGGTTVATVAWPVVDGAAQGLVAFVGGAVVDVSGIQRALKARLPAYMVPTRVIPVRQMPLNANGKVDRRALRQMLETGSL